MGQEIDDCSKQGLWNSLKQGHQSWSFLEMEGRMVGMAWELAGTSHPSLHWDEGVGGNASKKESSREAGSS